MIARPDPLHRARALAARGKLDEAERAFVAGASIAPRDAAVQHEVGLFLIRRGRRGAAADHLKRAVDLAPDEPVYLSNLAQFRLESGETDEAEALVSRALMQNPGFVPALELSSFLHLRAGRLAEAASGFAKVVARAPDRLHAGHNLVLALRDLGHTDEAAHQAETLLARAPQDAAALSLLADLRSRQNRFAEAIALHDRAASAGATGTLTAIARNAFALQHACDWSRRTVLRERVLRGLRSDAPPLLHPFMLLVDEAATAQDVETANRVRVQEVGRHAAALPPLRKQGDPARRPGRVRVGYLSGDFRNHAFTLLATGLFELHDRTLIETFGYGYGPPDASGRRERVARAFEQFRDLGGLDDDAAAEAIAADDIDVLVDVTLFADGGRPGIAARRPARVQASWVGYPATSAAPWIDVLIGDAVATPPEHDAHFTERVIRLPVCYFPQDPTWRLPGPVPSRASQGLPEKGVVFCCFNGSHKITPDVFALWMRLLGKVPGSVLWLLRSNPLAETHLRRAAGSAAVDPARLVMAPTVRWDDHVDRLQCADLFLDTQPYGAHTTASEALWAGLPLVTCEGPRFASRVAASILRTAGVPDLIAPTMAEYEALSVTLAGDPARRSTLRERLIAARQGGTLFRTEELARAMEAVFVRLTEERRE